MGRGPSVSSLIPNHSHTVSHFPVVATNPIWRTVASAFCLRGSILALAVVFVFCSLLSEQEDGTCTLSTDVHLFRRRSLALLNLWRCHAFVRAVRLFRRRFLALVSLWRCHAFVRAARLFRRRFLELDLHGVQPYVMLFPRLFLSRGQT